MYRVPKVSCTQAAYRYLLIKESMIVKAFDS